LSFFSLENYIISWGANLQTPQVCPGVQGLIPCNVLYYNARKEEGMSAPFEKKELKKKKYLQVNSK